MQLENLVGEIDLEENWTNIKDKLSILLKILVTYN